MDTTPPVEQLGQPSAPGEGASRPPSGRNRWLWIGVALGLLAIAAAALESLSPSGSEITPSTETPTDEASQPGGSVTIDTNPSCDLPVTEVPEHAFQYGVPEGWVSQTEDDVVVIAEDQEYLTAAFLYTARLREDASASQFLTRFADVFRSIIEAEGRTFSVSQPSGGETRATAEASASIEEGEVRGPFEVRKEGLFVTFLAYWAPEAELAAKKPTLKRVLGCFARDTVLDDDQLTAAGDGQASSQSAPSETFKSVGVGDTYQGQYFSLFLPAGWQVDAETDSGIDTSNGSGTAGFSYAYATGTSQAIEHASWASERLGLVGITGANLGNASDVPVDFQGYSVKSFPFGGTYNDLSVDGKITVGVYNTPDFGLGSYGSAFWGIQLADSSLWPTVRSTIQRMQDSLLTKDIGTTRQSAQLPTGTSIDDAGGSAITEGYKYRSAIQEKSAGAWSSAMRGYETYQSPSTGDRYDVPTNAYNPSGPDGAGYYRQLPGAAGGLEKLEPVE